MSLSLLLRLCGASLIVLALAHAVLWRALDWGTEIARLSPLNARVFAVHTFFIAFVLAGLGALSLGAPALLLAPSALARFLLCGVEVFWLLRLALQPLVFDRVMRNDWTASPIIRIGAIALFLVYVGVYGAALLGQLR